MLPRRSRIGRLYRHLTRRQPNRKAQWSQIAHMRQAGNIGFPKPQRASQPVVLTREEEPQPLVPLVEEWVEPAPGADENPEGARVRVPQGGLFVHRTTTAAIISLMLLFLGCAFAAFAGFVQFHSMTLARWGCWGAVISIAAAGAGIRLATIPEWRTCAARFTTISIVAMGMLFVALVTTGLAA